MIPMLLMTSSRTWKDIDVRTSYFTKSLIKLVILVLVSTSPQRLMFPPHTLPGGSWHTFILGKLWGAIRGLGEIFSSIFGLLIVGRLVWYLIKVLMNCSYIHSVHGCSAHLAWSFCTEVFFTRLYRRDQNQSGSERSDNDSSSQPKPKLRNRLLQWFRYSLFASKQTTGEDEETGDP